MKKVTKAVIPAAGYGTRFLPFTRSVPKEMIPLVDKPVIQYVVEEAAASGITDILVIVSAGKEALQNHFAPVAGLEARLAASGKVGLLEELRQIDGLARLTFVHQHVLNGLGGALRLAREFVGGDSFAVLLGDTVVDGIGKPATAQLLDAYYATGASVVGLERVERAKLRQYGVISGTSDDGKLYKLDALVEKPDPAEAPSDLAIASRYLLTPGIFDALDATGAGKNGEIQLTDAMRLLLGEGEMYGLAFAARRYDIGDKLEFLKSTVTFGLRRPEYREALLSHMRALLDEVK